MPCSEPEDREDDEDEPDPSHPNAEKIIAAKSTMDTVKRPFFLP
jgi:hypothetical protein